MMAEALSTRQRRANRPSAPSTRWNVRWLALAVILGLATALLALTALTKAADRRHVLMVTKPVAAGQPITADALSTVDIAFDTAGIDVVTAEQLPQVIGRTAAVALTEHELLATSDIATTPAVLPNERRVGVVLTAGHYPPDLKIGDKVMLVPIDGSLPAPIDARILDIRRSDQGSNAVVLVDQAVVAAVAQASAANQLALAGLPS
jgi:hypothetical protein